MMKPTTREVATILAKLCDVETVAGVLNALLCCEAEARLSDREVEIGERLFDQLTELCPQAVEIARGDAPEFSEICPVPDFPGIR